MAAHERPGDQALEGQSVRDAVKRLRDDDHCYVKAPQVSREMGLPATPRVHSVIGKRLNGLIEDGLVEKWNEPTSGAVTWRLLSDDAAGEQEVEN